MQLLLPPDDNVDAYSSGKEPGILRESGEKIQKVLVTAIGDSPQWREWLLWHLTRPGEAVVATMREGLVGTLAGDADLARTMAEAAPLFGARFERAATERGAYADYGSLSELQKRIKSGTADPQVLLRYLNAVLGALAESDPAWSDALAKSAGEETGLFAMLMRLMIERDGRAAAAWALTVWGNDGLLEPSFVKWMVGEGMTRDEKGAREWLANVASSARSGAVIGNVDMARFKDWFPRYAATREGWKLTRRRLALESDLVPTALRQALVDDASSHQADLWKLYGFLAASTGPMVDGLKGRVFSYLGSAGLPETALLEVAAQNSRAKDAVTPVWAGLFAEDSRLFATMKDELRGGLTASSAYVTGLKALRTVATKSWDGEKGVGPLARELLEADSPDELERLLYEEPRKAAAFVREFLAHEKLVEAWRQELILQATYFGRGDVFARLIKTKQELLREWDEEIRRELLDNPAFARNLMDALDARLSGVAGHKERIEALRRGLASLIFSDRVLMEQMLDDPGEAYKRSLRQAVTRVFGGYTASQWMHD
jgi:hypothetical protein